MVLNSNNDKYRLLIENLTDAYALHRLVTDSEGNPVDYMFLEVNKAFEEMTGLTGKNIIGKNLTEVFPGIEKSHFDWVSSYGKVVFTGKTAYFEQYSEPLDRYFEITAYRVDDQHFSTIFRDVTDRKEKEMKEKAVHKSQQLAQNVLDAMTANVCVLDDHGYILSVNQSWLNFAKSNDGNLEAVSPGVNYLEVCDKVEGKEREMADNFAAGIRELTQGNRDSFSMEYPCDAPGKKRCFFAEATSFLDKFLDSLLVVITHTDITARKQAEDELRKKEAFENLLMTMATGLVNVPLEEVDTAINGMLEKLGRFTGLDRVYVFQNDVERRVTINTYEWCAEGITPQISNLQAVPYENFLDLLTDFYEGEMVYIPSVAELPQGDSLRAILEPQQIRSLLMLPIIREGTNTGFVGFDAVRAERDFSENEISLLHVFIKLLVSIEERREKEQAMLDNETKLREAQRIAGLGRWEIDLKTGSLTWSDEIFNLLEINRENFEGTYEAFISFVHPDDRELLDQAYRESVKKKLPYKLEHRLLLPDKRIKWVSESGYTNYDASGNPVRSVGTVQDITERKQAELLVQARLDLLEFSTKNDLDAVLQRTLDEACALVDSPIGFYHFVNIDREEITLKAWSTATLEEFCAIGSLSGRTASVDEAGVFIDCIQEKKPVIHNDYYSLPHRKGLPDGHAEVIRELVVPILRRDKVVAFLGVGNKAQDYTDRDTQIVSFFADLAWEIVEKKQAEESLAKSEEKHRRLFETMAHGVVYHAADGEIISANPAAEEILGLSFDQMQGKTTMDPRWQMLEDDGTPVPGTDHPAMIALRTGQTVGPVTRGVFHPHKNSHVWLSITAIPLFQPGKTEPSQVYATFSDITTRKEAEDELRMKDQAVAASINAVAIADLEGKLIYVNPAFLKMWGYDNEADVLGRSALEFWEKSQHARSVMQSLFENGAYQGDLVARSAGGESFDVYLSTTMIYDPDGAPLNLMATFIDITERKQMEEALRESKLKIQDILSNIPDNGAVFQFIQKADENYEVSFISDSAVSIFEKPIETLHNTTRLFEDIHSDDLPGMWSTIEQSAQDMAPWKYNFRIITRTSGQKWIRGFSNPRRLDDGSICWTGMLLDITAQKQAEDALVEKQQFNNLQAEVAEAFLNTYEHEEESFGNAFNKALQRTCEFFAADRSFLFELSPGGDKMINTYQWCKLDKAGQPDPPIIFPVTDLPWTYEQLSRYGYLHIPEVELMPPEANAEKDIFKGLQFKSIIAVPLIVQDALYGFLAYTTVNETKHWNEEQIKNIRAIGEKITTIILRKRLLKQKEDAYDKALSVLDSIDALIYVADMETHEILYINRFGLEVWGDAEGKKCWEALQENQTGPCDFCSNYILLDENGQSTGIHRWQHKNTLNSRWYEISDQAIRWIDGKMKRMSIAIDITELKETEQKLEEARKEAEEANRAKSRFLATISHEIRNPMNVITGMTGLLCEANLADPLHEYACMANDSADHLLGIIDDILDFSRIEVDQLEIMATRIKLVQEVENTVSIFNNQAAQKGLELLYHLDEQLPEEVLLDPARLKQVLMNLIGNAIKFTEKGTVELLVWLEEDEKSAINDPSKRRIITFAVKDTGPGIAEKDKPHIFERFSQVKQGMYPGSGGTGLGLAISKNLVELMGGELWLDSEPGKGSTFYFTLPFSVPEEAEAEEKAAGKIDVVEEGEKNILTLLLVEDKPMNQKLVKVFLEQMGHRVVLAANGKEAVEAVKANRFDAVLMDINMPEMDGLEATQKIRAWEKKSGRHRTTIIAMTAYAMKGDRDKFLKAGLDDYISKPIKKEALAEALQQVEQKATKLTADQAEKDATQSDVTFESPDISTMLERVDGNTDLLKELVEYFLEDYHRETVELEKAINKGDYNKAGKIMHGFKGELGNLCMDEAYHLAKELDKMLKSENLEHFAPTLDRFKKSVAKYESYFSQQ